MENNIDLQKLEANSFKSQLILIRTNLISFLTIIFLSAIVSIVYALILPDIYVSETSIKVSKSNGDVLQSKAFRDFGDLGNDRAINNEIEILKSRDLRKIIANSILDSIAQSPSKDDFKLLYKSESKLRINLS